MRFRHLALAALVLSACGPANTVQAQPNPPVETGPPNAPDQKPAFPSRPVRPSRSWAWPSKVETLATGLDHPWSLAFLPDGPSW
jgi:glucose/arabinose dehydrogenase